MSGARVKCFAAVMLLLACSLPSSLQTPEKGGVGPLGRLAALAGTRLRLQGVKPASTAWDSGGRVFGLSRTPQVQRLRGGWLCHNLVMQKAQASVQKDTHKTQQHQQQASDHVTAPEPEAPVTVNNSAMASLEAEVANLQAQVQSREAVGEPGEVEHVQGGGSSGGEPEPGESITRFEDIGRRTTALRQLSQDLEKLESWIDTAVQGYNKISDVLETEEALNHVPTETEIYRGRLSELRARWQLLYESARRILNTSPNDSTTKLFQGRCRDMLETDAKLSLLELKVSQECEWTEEGRKKLENGMGGVVYQVSFFLAREGCGFFCKRGYACKSAGPRLARTTDDMF